MPMVQGLVFFLRVRSCDAHELFFWEVFEHFVEHGVCRWSEQCAELQPPARQTIIRSCHPFTNRQV